MKYEKPVVTLIDLGAEDVITSSVGETSTSTAAGCGDAASQYAESWVSDCNNPNHKTSCTNKAHRGENL